MSKVFRHPCACVACDRLLKDTFHVSKKPLPGLAKQYTNNTYLCVDCDSVLKRGDAIIKEYEDSTGRALTTGVSNYIDLTKQTKHTAYWNSKDVFAGKITMIWEGNYDQIMRDCNTHCIVTHDMQHLIVPFISVPRAFRYK